MTGCRLTIFTLSVVFGKSFPKHVSLVKARFGDVLGSGRQGTARGCKDFDVQIFSQWIQFVLLGTLWLCFDIEAYCLGPNSPICQAP
ncbi:unnamed protein product [Effrenium voratum]|nr:unnamed protein product [Effrenium voratum]